MLPILLRIGLLTLGLAAVELGLPPALAVGGASDWLVSIVGMLLLIAGSAGFIGPLLGWAARKGDTSDA
jgi:hypothetical protein